jgi:hypothetical protein
MKPMRKAVVAAALVGSTLTGGAIGAAVFAGSSAGAQTSSTTTAPASPAVGANGTFHSNEDAAHEAGESAEREAQEDAGQRPTVP